MIKESNPSYSLIPQFGFQSGDIDRDWKLKLHCNTCHKNSSYLIGRYKNEETCLECVLTVLIQESKKRVKMIEFENNIFTPLEDVKLLVTLAELYCNWKTVINQIQLCDNNKCFLNLSPKFSDLIYYLIQQKDGSNTKLCTQCRKKLKYFFKIYSKSEFSSLLLKIPENDNWQKIVFIGSYSEKKYTPSIPNQNKNEILTTYKVLSYPLFNVTISSDTIYECSIKISTIYGNKSSEFYSAIIFNLEKKIVLPHFDHLLPVGTILEKYIDFVQNYLRINYHNLDFEEIYNIALFFSVKETNISKLFPLLVDSLIDEIYLDNPQQTVYIDHRDFGRCKTSITLTDQDLNSLKTFLRISSNKRLDPTNPSIKCSIHNKFFHCRFAVDISPIVLSGFSLNIRKMNRKIFTLPELIQRGMLSSQIAAFLYVCVLFRLNITAVGETNTGKTTLINSLDLLAPSHYRKIYIEESPESLDQSFFSNHQLKYLVDPGYSNSSKIQEIYRLLHRNPDLVYLGEILSKEEAQAMFHCLSAGLRGFQTIHARDINSLLNRWQYHFTIDPACYNDLDIIILLKRFTSKRYVSEVVELTFSDESTSSHIIFQFDPETSTWSNMPNVELLHCFKRKNLSIKDIQMINDQLAFYETIFDSLSTEQEWNVSQQVRYFHLLYNKIENLKENKTKINWNSLNLTSEVI